MTASPLADFSAYGTGLGNAVSVIRNNAVAAGLAASVPTCPGWSVEDLIKHLGSVHRWATMALQGAPTQTVSTWVEPEVEHSDLLDWLDDGLVDLLNAVIAAPPHQISPIFLLNAPDARTAWTRRQCHETTIHAVDAMSARLGRAPTAAQTWISPELAVDGLDELLRGFLPRAQSRVRAEVPRRVLVALTDTTGPGVDRGWLLTISQDPVLVTSIDLAVDRQAAQASDVVVSGGAVPLYLGLWNRGTEFEVSGDPTWLSQWREQMQIG